jgi:hypothetical protein
MPAQVRRRSCGEVSAPALQRAADFVQDGVLFGKRLEHVTAQLLGRFARALRSLSSLFRRDPRQFAIAAFVLGAFSRCLRDIAESFRTGTLALGVRPKLPLGFGDLRFDGGVSSVVFPAHPGECIRYPPPRTVREPIGYERWASSPRREILGVRDEKKVFRTQHTQSSMITDLPTLPSLATPPFVLVVDDIADHREMYIEYLRFAGFRVAGAADGASAIDAARTLRPSVILMDLSLPGIDGWEATRILKSDPQTRDI